MRKIIDMMGLFANNTEAFREPITECIKALEGYGPEAYEFMSKFTRAAARLKVEAIKEYQASGFSREEAIILACNQYDGMVKALQSRGK